MKSALAGGPHDCPHMAECFGGIVNSRGIEVTRESGYVWVRDVERYAVNGIPYRTVHHSMAFFEADAVEVRDRLNDLYPPKQACPNTRSEEN